ncbi:MAG: hypothetical protein B6D36_01655 [Planctomycetes bacterium UTPLA1]|nr:MAG: hypothetical protein B6D36_01655 [Planctomycetes bacterium UTPLA1]
MMVAGCGNPVTDAVKLGLHVVGKVVDDAEVDKLGGELLGQPPSQADAVLGEKIDVYADVDHDREWRVYPVPVDVLNNHRYVVETTADQIVLVEKVELNSDKLDIPLELVYDEKLKGKTAAECETALKMGPPLIVLRSKSTGQMFRLYDARLIKELPKPHYLVVRFDGSDRCEKVKFAEIAASDSQP